MNLTNNERLNQLAYMFSYLTKLSLEESLNCIRKTNTGKAIENQNPSILYEQQFDDEQCAEDEMFHIAAVRNRLEDELSNY